ncbi:MAG: bifunctional biotin--[acetyl-CoA-carboxylase] ligase/biotin operon repressor BirA [Pseudomonadota bacterium]
MTQSSVTQQLVALLADGEWHSGQALADVLGVSRTAVWKNLSKLEPLGLLVESSKGKGYRLLNGAALLNAEHIYAQCSELAQEVFSLPEVLFSIGSTNDHALDNLTPGYVCLSEHQTQGKGRRGNEWVTPFGSQIAMSFVCEFNGGIADMAGLSLVVGLNVVNALDSLGYDDVSLKWPNDVLYQGKKLGGILLEIRGDVSGPCQVVVGIGLNVSVHADSADIERVDQSWIDLRTITRASTDDEDALQRQLNRNHIVSAILNECATALSDFSQVGFSYYRQTWIDRDAFHQQRVCVLHNQQRINGIEQGVDDEGQLLLETDSGIKVYNGGDVSLRLL